MVTYIGLVTLEQLFRRNRFWKALGLIVLALAILTAARMMIDFRAPFLVFGIVNGAFFRTIEVLVHNRAARTGIVAAALALLGVIFFPATAPRFPYALAATCASWIAMAAAYRHMADMVGRIDAALLHRLQRM